MRPTDRTTPAHRDVSETRNVHDNTTTTILAVLAIFISVFALLSSRPTPDSVVKMAIMQGLACGIWVYAARRASRKMLWIAVLPAGLPIVAVVGMIVIWGVNTYILHSR